jgi:hypothetical protein
MERAFYYWREQRCMEASSPPRWWGIGRAIAMLGSTLSLRVEHTEARSNCSPLDGSRFRRQNDRSGRSTN